MLACPATSWDHTVTYTLSFGGEVALVLVVEEQMYCLALKIPPSNIVETWNFGMANKVYPPPPHLPLDMSGVGHVRWREERGVR